MTVSQRQSLENAVVSALGDAYHISNGGYLKHVAPYSGDMTGEDGSENFRRVVLGKSPAMLVTTGGSEIEVENNHVTIFFRTVELIVYVISQHSGRNESRARMDTVAQGDATKDPGCYKMLEDVHEVISGNDFATTGIGHARPTSESLTTRTDDVEIWALNFDVVLRSDLDPRDFGTDSLTGYSFEVNNTDQEPTNPEVSAESDLT